MKKKLTEESVLEILHPTVWKTPKEIVSEFVESKDIMDIFPLLGAMYVYLGSLEKKGDAKSRERKHEKPKLEFVLTSGGIARKAKQQNQGHEGPATDLLPQHT